MDLSVGISSDTDDAVMVYAMDNKLIPGLDRYRFSIIREDIEVLNKTAMDSGSDCYDITALSAAVLPKLTHYGLLPCGASFGRLCGPALVVASQSEFRSPKDLRGRRVGVPGENTSAYATLQMLLPEFQPEFMPFDHIAAAVASGVYDAGVLIHEAQLAVPPELRKIGELSDMWQQHTKDSDLPLPLGVIGIKKSLPERVKKDLTKIYKASIDYAMAHLFSVTQAVMDEYGHDMANDLSFEDTLTYVTRYVSDCAGGFSDGMKNSLQLWYQIGADKGLWPAYSVMQ